MEARIGIEPMIKVLQTSALPLGYRAITLVYALRLNVFHLSRPSFLFTSLSKPLLKGRHTHVTRAR